jgi:hypothetical protein
MVSTTFTYKNKTFEINSQKQLYIDFKRHGVLTIQDFNNIFAREDVKKNVTSLKMENFWGLTEIPENLFKLENLHVLQIIHCNIQNLTESIGNLINITELYLKNCNLQDLPNSLENLRNLRVLNIENEEVIEGAPVRFENKINATQHNVAILTAIHNNGNIPIIRIDTGFGGLNLVSERKYKSGTTKDKPFKKNMLLANDFKELKKLFPSESTSVKKVSPPKEAKKSPKGTRKVSKKKDTKKMP